MTTINVKALFPHKEFTPFPTDRNPNAMEVTPIKKELLANVGAVPSSLGGGTCGHMGMHVDSGSISTSLPVTDILRSSANDGKLVSYVKL